MKLKYNEKFVKKVIKNSDILVIAISASERFYKIKSLPNQRFYTNCIFHDDKHPSMILDCKDNSFHCLTDGCKKRGDIIGFVMKLYQLDCVSAVQLLALAFDIDLPKNDLLRVNIELSKQIKEVRKSSMYEELIEESHKKTLKK